MEIPRPSPDEIAEDQRAAFEEASLATGIDISKAESDRKIRKLLQEGSVENHIHNIKVTALYGASTIIAIMFLVLFFHYTAPKSWGFLDSEQIQALKQVLFSGSIGAILSNLIGRHFK